MKARSTSQKMQVAGITFVVSGVAAEVDGDKSYMTGATTRRVWLEVAAALADLGIVTGETFRFARKALGLKATEAGELLDRSAETISLWENDKTPIDRAAWAALGSLIAERLGRAEGAMDRLRAAANPPRRRPKTVQIAAA